MERKLGDAQTKQQKKHSDKTLSIIVGAAVADVYKVDPASVLSLAHYLVLLAKAQKFVLGGDWEANGKSGLFALDKSLATKQGLLVRDEALDKMHCVSTLVSHQESEAKTQKYGLAAPSSLPPIFSSSPITVTDDEHNYNAEMHVMQVQDTFYTFWISPDDVCSNKRNNSQDDCNCRQCNQYFVGWYLRGAYVKNKQLRRVLLAPLLPGLRTIVLGVQIFTGELNVGTEAEKEEAKQIMALIFVRLAAKVGSGQEVVVSFRGVGTSKNKAQQTAAGLAAQHIGLLLKPNETTTTNPVAGNAVPAPATVPTITVTDRTSYGINTHAIACYAECVHNA